MKRILSVYFILFSVVFGKAQSIPELKIQTSHSSTVVQTVFSHTGDWIATASEDKTIKIWDNETGKLIQTINNEGFVAKSLAFHPKMNILAASCGNNIRFLNIKDGTTIATFTGHKAEVYAIDFSLDGEYMVTGGLDELAIIWNVNKRKKVTVLKEKIDYTNTIFALAFSADGQYVYTAGEDIYIKMWDWRKKKIVNRFAMHPNKINDIAVNTYNTLLASASNDRTIKIFNINSGELITTLTNFDAPVQKIEFHPFLDKLVAAYYESVTDSTNNLSKTSSIGHLALIDYDTKKIEWEHTQNNGFLDFTINPIDNTIATASTNNIVNQYSLNNGNYYKDFGVPTHINDISYVAERNELLVSGEDGFLKVWNLSEGVIKEVIDTKIEGQITAISYNTNTGQLVVAAESIVQFWKYNTTLNKYVEINSFTIPEGNVNDIYFVKDNANIIISRTEHINKINNTDLLNIFNGGVIPEEYLASFDTTYFEVWNPFKGQFLVCVDDIASPSAASAIHPLYNRLVFSEPSKGIMECDLDNDNFVNSLLAFNSRGTLVANLATSQIQGMNANQQLNQEDVDIEKVTIMAFSSDGKYLAFGGNERNLSIMNTITGGVIKTGNFTSKINDISFSADNKYIAIASSIKAQIWETATGILKHEYFTLQPIDKVLFVENGTKLVTVSDEDAIKLWDVEKESLIARLIPVGKEDYITVVEDIYYRSSKNGVSGVGLYYRGYAYPIEQFWLQYDRPEKILQALGNRNSEIVGLYNTLYQKRLQRNGFDETSVLSAFHLPTVEITEPEFMVQRTRSGRVLFTCLATDTDYKLKNMQVRINNVPIYGKQGLDLSTLNTDRFTQKFHLQLEYGTNIVQVSTTNIKGIESLPTTFEIYNELQAEQRNLYIIGLGARDYISSTNSLRYSQNDVSTLISTLTSNTESYDNVYIDTLYNENLTMQNILTIRQKLLSSGIDDDVVIIINGHAHLNEQYNYFLLLHETDLNNIEQTAFPIDSIESFFDGIPSRNRFAMLDLHQTGNLSVHAGEILLNETLEHMNLTTGATYIATISDTEHVFLFDNQRYGGLTYCMLNAMEGNEADYNADGALTINEMGKYFEKKITTLTNNKERVIVKMNEITGTARLK